MRLASITVGLAVGWGAWGAAARADFFEATNPAAGCQMSSPCTSDASCDPLDHCAPDPRTLSMVCLPRIGPLVPCCSGSGPACAMDSHVAMLADPPAGDGVCLCLPPFLACVRDAVQLGSCVGTSMVTGIFGSGDCDGDGCRNDADLDPCTFMPACSPVDAGPADAGRRDAGNVDAGRDGGVDAGTDAARPDAGPPDAGPADTGPPEQEDAGIDAGSEEDAASMEEDAGPAPEDAGETVDSGETIPPFDAGPAATSPRFEGSGGCGKCSTGATGGGGRAGWFLVVVAASGLLRVRRRARQAARRARGTAPPGAPGGARGG